MDEVTDPSLTVFVEGFLITGGLKLYILNKMKDTSVDVNNVGEKKPTYVPCYTLNKGNIINKTFIFSKVPINTLNSNKRTFFTKVKASKRIGPHNQDVISVIIGSLLGDAYASARSIEGTRFVYKQSVIHKDYLFSLYDFFHTRGYCSNLQPRLFSVYIKKESITSSTLCKKEYFRYEFNTYTFRSFN